MPKRSKESAWAMRSGRRWVRCPHCIALPGHALDRIPLEGFNLVALSAEAVRD